MEARTVDHLSIVYDGQCPLCRRIVLRTRLHGDVKQLESVDARSSPLRDVQGVDCRKLDLNRGFAVIADGRLFLGADAARVLAVRSAPDGTGTRVLRWLFSGRRRGRLSYVLARACRNVLLRLLRVPKLPPPE